MDQNTAVHTFPAHFTPSARHRPVEISLRQCGTYGTKTKLRRVDHEQISHQ
ncbi:MULTISPECIES: hypothetical protein [unclassified Sphingomonas]|uniref:hypothetical protein n=1 Tax=unclassified Sphingomonas TaxID=196159 RepID=UPI0012E21F06|nr:MULTISPECIES: hypothetical protein [unclassified Sphingomonas]